MARLFNGSTHWINVAVSPDLGADFAMWAWVRTTTVAAGSGQILCSDITIDPDLRNFQFRRSAASLQIITFASESPTTETASSVFSTNTWTFVGATRRGGSVFLYHGTTPGILTEFDGGAANANDQDAADVQIGVRARDAAQTDLADFFSGDICQVGLMNAASLTKKEFESISLHTWSRQIALFELPMFGLGSPEPDWSGNKNVGVLKVAPSLSNHVPIIPYSQRFWASSGPLIEAAVTGSGAVRLAGAGGLAGLGGLAGSSGGLAGYYDRSDLSI